MDPKEKQNEVSEEPTEETVSEPTPEAEAEQPGEAPEKEKDKEKDKKPSRKEQKEIESLKAQLAEKNDQYLRLAAEYENFRKRSEKEKSDLYAAAYGSALAAFLPLTDSLYQASLFTPDDEGIKALTKQNADILEKLGIKEMETDGKPFDPNLHNAIMHEENAEVGENTIVQTFQKGYLLGDKVLRPAMVKVAN